MAAQTGPMDHSVISKLYELDPEFRDVYDGLYGVSKSTDGADLHVDGTGASRRKKGVAAGLVAGSAAEGLAVHRSVQAVRAMPPKPASVTTLKRGFKLKAIDAAHGKAGKVAEAAFQTGNLLVGLTAAKELVAKPKPVAKAFSLKPLNPADVRRTPSLRARRRPVAPLTKGLFRNVKTVAANAAEASESAKKVTADAAEAAQKAKRLIPKRRTAAAIGAGAIAATGAANFGATYEGSKRGTAAGLKVKPVAKSFTLDAKISKMDEDQRLFFGWASVSEINGEPVVDLQGDVMPIEEVEKSAYQYVLECRVGGDQHARVAKSGTAPRHTADLIESVVITPEKLEKWGLAPDALPLGWWTGFHVNDEQTWHEIKTRKRTGLSVHGSGRREEVLV